MAELLTLNPSNGNIGEQISSFLRENLQEIQRTGAFRVEVTSELLEQLRQAVLTQYDRKDELGFEEETYHGYQNRARSQQEIICLRSDEVDSSAYAYLFEIARGALSHFGSPASRLSPVFWRYDPQNKPEVDLGFEVHEDWSPIGVTFQCDPGLFWVPEEGKEIDLWTEDPTVLVTFGQGAKDRGFTPFVHGVKRVKGTTRLAGGVFVDFLDNQGGDVVGEKMKEYEERE